MKTLDSRAGYDLYAPHYRQDHGHLDSFDWEATRVEIMLLIESLVSTSAVPIRLLDLGCGDGRILKRLQRSAEQRNWSNKLELHGWDISDGMLKQAAKTLGPTVHLQRRDLRDPVPRRDFQLIVSCFVLVHIESAHDFVQALFDLLTAGGKAVFNNIPQRQALVLESSGQKFQILYEHHEDDEISQAIEELGLELIFEKKTNWSTLFAVRKPSTL